MRGRRRVRIVVGTAAVITTVAGLSLLSEQVYMAAKAVLANAMITEALAAHLRDGRVHRPWPGADHHPVGELRVDRLRIRRPILSDASRASLAFAVGHVRSTASPGDAGHCALAGHRHTTFRFLEKLEGGDEVRLRVNGGERRFVVEECFVVDHREAGVCEPIGDGDRLTLITCYPFDAFRRGPWRYVVVCRSA